MKQICLQDAGLDAAPRTTEISLYPDIDNTYTPVSYQGDRLVVRTTQVAGIKDFGYMVASKQGMAIYGDKVVRMANVATSTTHYVYQVSSSGFSEIATFTLGGTLHSNALQFAPVLEAGQTLPYLYVAGLEGKCFVLSFDSSYQATIVQTITITGGGQVLIGDDGYIWDSGGGTGGRRKFAKYRKVAVTEGDVTLTDADKLDEWETEEIFDSSVYTAQGWKVKFGKIWFSYGAEGAGKVRGISVYDTASHRLVATLDFSDFATAEWEDLDFWDNSILVAMYTAAVYIIRV